MKIRDLAIVFLSIVLLQTAYAQKRVAYIKASGTNTYDTNCMNALSTVGITASGVPIPGLGYRVFEIIQGAPEPDPVDSTIADLLFISQSVTSSNVKHHEDDPIPIIVTEGGLYHSDPTRGTLYFSATSGERNFAPYLNTFYITDNSHPITQIFPVGPKAMWVLTGSPRIGWMSGEMAPGVSVLARVETATSYPCLAVCETGAQLRPGGPNPGYNPAPARRVVLGYQGNSMNVPTSAGIFLLQRCAQWAIGDPVTAGGALPPPAAPTNLRVTGTGDKQVGLAWDTPSGTVAGYRVMRSGTAGGPYTQATTTSLTTAIVSGLTNGTTYFFVVRAYNAGGDSPNSNEVQATPTGGSLRARRWAGYN
ncbi:MAG: fibronectin type III domain-containing protein [Candidatus Sumerlaeia bacterium]|nr:fibronectin type III domain-containing protein [Candidatus Sumerlaeia bacterium]